MIIDIEFKLNEDQIAEFARIAKRNAKRDKVKLDETKMPQIVANLFVDNFSFLHDEFIDSITQAAYYGYFDH